MSLADFIQDEVSRQAGEEALRTKVQSHIDATIAEAVKAAFSYGDLNKQIRAAVDKSLALPGDLDVPQYGNMVLAVLRQRMDEILTPIVHERLAKEMGDILRTGAREMKLSDLVEKMKEGEDLSDRFGSRCTCIVEDSSSPGYLTIYLDPDEVDPSESYGYTAKKRKREAEARIGVTPGGKIYHLVLDEKDAKTSVRVGAGYGWQKTLFALYATDGKLIVDADDVDTSYGDF